MVEHNQASHDNFSQRSDCLINNEAQIVSENVAYGFQDAKSALQAWLESPSYKAIIEEGFRHTGITVVTNENGIKNHTQLL